MSSALRRKIWLVIYALFCFGAANLLFLVLAPTFQNFPTATLEDMIYGRANKPFVYRTLAPTTIRLISAAIPTSIHDLANQFAANNATIQFLTARYSWNVHYTLEYALAFLSLYLLIYGFLFSMRFLIRSVYQATPLFTDITSLCAVFFLIAFNGKRYTNYIYDITTLILFTLALGLLARERLRLYLLVFVLACLNKETAIFLTLAYVLHFWRRWRERDLWIILIAQGAAYLVIKGGLTLIFQDNPGGIVEDHLTHNLAALAAITPLAIVLIIGLAVMIGYCWSEKPALLRQALWMIVPLFVLGVFYGVIDEIRIFYEVYPVVFLLIVHSAAILFKFNLTTKPDARAQPDQSSRRAFDPA